MNPQINIHSPPLCFGGSFNPIHFGHLRCAEAAAVARGFDSVMLIPSAQPPHKTTMTDLAPADDRLQMTILAAESMSVPVRFLVNDLELRRDGPSYTIQTVIALQNEGWSTVSWLIGADMLNYLPRWHRIDELLGKVEFLILQRPGVPIDWAALPPNFQHLRGNIVTAPLIDLSATDIRARIRANQPIDGMTPPAVIEYIRNRGLYKIG